MGLLTGWLDEDWVEVNLDFADQLAARSEYTTLFLGPPRARMLSPIEKALFAMNSASNSTFGSLLSIFKSLSPGIELLGMAQGISFSVSRGRTPIAEMGYERPLIASSPMTLVQIGISRLIAAKENFTKKVTNVSLPEPLQEEGGGLLSSFIESANYDLNLHREESYWPFGLGVIFAAEFNAAPIAKLYFENCKIVAIGSQVSAGQGIIMENVQIISHRGVQVDSSKKEDNREY